MICWLCGRRLVQAVTGKPVPGVEIIVDGRPLRAHKQCAERDQRDRDAGARALLDVQLAREASR